MKTLIIILTFLYLSSCTQDKVVEKKVDHLYFLTSCRLDTHFISKPSFDTTNLTIIATEEFIDDRQSVGKITKLTYDNAPIDGGGLSYLSKDLGIIYTKSATSSCYSRLHSTNDSIERKINLYIEHILSKPNFVIQGEHTVQTFEGDYRNVDK